jgi:hypothetical protein
VRSTPAGSRSSWWKWGVPITVLAVLAAVLGGVAARRLDAAPAASPGGAAVPSPRMPEPGPYVVDLTSGAAQNPDSAAVLQLLQGYFSAINSKRYDQWEKTVVAPATQELPPDVWQEAYSSTKDGSVLVDGIESSGDALQVLVSFTSVQDVAHAPPQLPAPCVRWRVAYRMVMESGALRLDGTVLPGSIAVAPCS